jgi:hypothetical protein
MERNAAEEGLRRTQSPRIIELSRSGGRLSSTARHRLQLRSWPTLNSTGIDTIPGAYELLELTNARYRRQFLVADGANANRATASSLPSKRGFSLDFYVPDKPRHASIKAVWPDTVLGVH